MTTSAVSDANYSLAMSCIMRESDNDFCFVHLCAFLLVSWFVLRLFEEVIGVSIDHLWNILGNCDMLALEVDLNCAKIYKKTLRRSSRYSHHTNNNI